MIGQNLASLYNQNIDIDSPDSIEEDIFNPFWRNRFQQLDYNEEGSQAYWSNIDNIKKDFGFFLPEYSSAQEDNARRQYETRQRNRENILDLSTSIAKEKLARSKRKREKLAKDSIDQIESDLEFSRKINKLGYQKDLITQKQSMKNSINKSALGGTSGGLSDAMNKTALDNIASKVNMAKTTDAFAGIKASKAMQDIKDLYGGLVDGEWQDGSIGKLEELKSNVNLDLKKHDINRKMMKELRELEKDSDDFYEAWQAGIHSNLAKIYDLVRERKMRYEAGDFNTSIEELDADAEADAGESIADVIGIGGDLTDEQTIYIEPGISTPTDSDSASLADSIVDLYCRNVPSWFPGC